MIDKLEQAKKYIESGYFQKAIKILEIEKENNSDYNIFFELGKAYLCNNNFKQAVLNLKQSLRIQDNIWSKILLAKSLKSLFQTKESLKILFEVKKSNCQINDVDIEIVSGLSNLKKYLFAYKYVDKYLNDRYDLKLKIVQVLLCNLVLKLQKNVEFVNKEYIQKIEIISNDILEHNIEDQIIKEHLLKMYLLVKQNCFKKKQSSMNFIKNACKNGNDKQYDNFVLNQLEIQKKEFCLSSNPVNLIVTLTNLCNIKCIFCSLHKDKLWNLAENIVSQIVDMLTYLRHISWLGGEVFLYDNFEKLFDLAKQKNIHQEIVTNGLLLNKHWIDKLITSNTKLAISVTSAEQHKYEFLHKGAKISRLISNLKYIKSNLHKRSPNFQLWMYILIFEENYSELESVIDFAHKYGVDVVRFQPLIQENSSVKFKNIFDEKYENLDRVKTVLKNAIKKAKFYGIKIDNILPISADTEYVNYDNVDVVDKDKLFCTHPWTTMVINYKGNITFDCSCLQSKSVGNVLENKLMAIWNSKETQKFRKKIIEKKYMDICNINCVKYGIQNCYK